jgi:hypothetical protein
MPGPKPGNWLAWLGLAAIAAGLWLIRGDSMFPGWWALLPALGAFLLIAAPPTAWVNRHLLANRVMVGIGLISYPLYLWHIPVLVMARIVHLEIPPAWARGLLLLLSVALATATYFWVEKPLRFRLPARKSVPVLVTATALTLIVGVACFLDAGVPGRFSLQLELQPLLTFRTDHDFAPAARRDTCWLDAKDPTDGFASICVDPPASGKRLVLLWGDSHAARFYPGLKAMDDGRDRLAQFTRNACAPILGEHRYEWCDASNNFVAIRIQALKPDIVVLFSRWAQHLSTEPQDPRIQELKTTIAKLRQWGVKRILVIGPAPTWKADLPHDLSRLVMRQHGYAIPTRTTWMLEPGIDAVDDALARSLSGLPDVTYFSAFKALCDDSGCLTTVDGTVEGLTASDYGHLTPKGATYVAQKLLQETGYPNLR